MSLTFIISSTEKHANQPSNIAYLEKDNWDDFGFKTLFFLTVYDEEGQKHKIGNVKIGSVGQTEGYTNIEPQQFKALPENYFSLGQDSDYYQKIIERLSSQTMDSLLKGLGDVAYDNERFQIADKEAAFNTSLLRVIRRTSIKNQFKRIIAGGAALTEYNFSYNKEPNEFYSGVSVKFKVLPNSTPPTNIHILIGRNGVGKTTLLNNMVDAILPNDKESSETGMFTVKDGLFDDTEINEYFAGVVSVSFSAFDPFTPPQNQQDINNGIRYHYVGLKNQNTTSKNDLKSKKERCSEFIESLKTCLSLSAKKNRWIKAVKKLESDLNFRDMKLCRLVKVFNSDISPNKIDSVKKIKKVYSKMSSGHAIVLLSITKLVETVEEKTLVLLDEPESHLHPPLLSAFIRALSDLLVNRNAVALLATHSPVVLQEVPKSCVSILDRTRLVLNVYRPENETFAENVGILTREVFGLEVSKSGFHELLKKSVDAGKSYETIEQEYGYQIGFEGKAILRSLIASRDSE